MIDQILQWLKAWSPTLQLLAFIALTYASIKLSRKTGEVIEEQRDIIESQSNLINKLKLEIEMENRQPEFIFHDHKTEELGEENEYAFRATCKLLNVGGRAKNIKVKSPMANEQRKNNNLSRNLFSHNEWSNGYQEELEIEYNIPPKDHYVKIKCDEFKNEEKVSINLRR